jgi:predicted Rossmann fold flavoprotein
MQKFDVIVIGGGASGLHAAALAGKKNKTVLLIEHNREFGKKILISGGGRCNFTNANASAVDFQSSNKHFFKSALSRYSPQEFIKLVDIYKIKWFEKKEGQLFCENSAKEVRDMLVRECEKAGAKLSLNTKVENVIDAQDGFRISTNIGEFFAHNLVIATGGLSIPPIGATDFGYQVAKQFGHKIIQTEPALVPFTLQNPFTELSGVSLPVSIKVGKNEIQEDLLFTHKGFSGPAALKISLYWNSGDRIKIDFTNGKGISPHINSSKKNILTVLAESFPKRFCERFLSDLSIETSKPANQVSKKDLNRITEHLCHYSIIPSGTEGFRKAEVTRGGVDVKEISSQTMESKLRSGLYFIGEVVDVTGQLGGFNFQWAWASAHAFAESLE